MTFNSIGRIKILILAGTIILAALFCLPAAASTADITIYIEGVQQYYDAVPVVENGTTMVPMRGIFESLGASVHWDPVHSRIDAHRSGTTLVLHLNSRQALVNGEPVTMTLPVRITNGRTLVPLRFISESLGEQVEWNGTTRQVHIGTTLVRHSQPAVTVGIKTFRPKVLEIPLNDERIGLKAVLGADIVGGIESLESMATRNKGLAAINGTFFSAYTSIQEPYGNLIVNGNVVHVGTAGTTFGFTSDNEIAIDPVRFRIEGGTHQSFQYPNNWYAYWINRTTTAAANSVTIFTPARGSQIGITHGRHVVVRNGKVTAIGTGDVAIPPDGYVIHLNGSETYLMNRFFVGSPVTYRINFNPTRSDKEFWSRAQGAIGAGPTLVVNSSVQVNPTSEGFIDPKILTESGARSALGVTADHKLLMVTVDSATIHELAQLMVRLGAAEAMNLDGGASSGLYANGHLLTPPGRLLSNALVVYRKN